MVVLGCVRTATAEQQVAIQHSGLTKREKEKDTQQGILECVAYDSFHCCADTMGFYMGLNKSNSIQ